jgi:hypothetical protein
MEICGSLAKFLSKRVLKRVVGDNLTLAAKSALKFRPDLLNWRLSVCAGPK